MNPNSLDLDIYQQVILEHNRHPQNFFEMPNPTLKAEGFNPLCGDHLWLYLQTDAQSRIQDISFQGSGCAISKASASMMTMSLKGKTLKEAEVLFEEFHHLITGELNTAENQLGKLKVFAGICRYPSRIKCAGLAWHTLRGALKKIENVVSTE